MVDIMLGNTGDIVVSAVGDISLTHSIQQAVMIRLRWIFGEWRLGPDLGFPWFEEIFVKNPNIIKIKGLIREEIKKVDGVVDASVDDVVFDRSTRAATFRYTVKTEEETYREEVTLYG